MKVYKIGDRIISKRLDTPTCPATLATRILPVILEEGEAYYSGFFKATLDDDTDDPSAILLEAIAGETSVYYEPLFKLNTVIKKKHTIYFHTSESKRVHYVIYNKPLYVSSLSIKYQRRNLRRFLNLAAYCSPPSTKADAEKFFLRLHLGI